MSVSTYKADAWICVFERLPPPHPDEARLVRGLGREAFVAVCVTVEREIRRIVFLDQTINAPHAQVLLSELDPENREIVFVAAPTILRLLLTQWEMVTKVKRVVHDIVPPFVPGSYVPVTDYGRDALVELVSRPTLPKGFVAAVRRRVGQRWRAVHSPVIPVPIDIRPFLCEFGLWQTVHHPSGSFTQRIQPTAERQQLPVATPTPAVIPSAAVPSAATAVFPNNRTDQHPVVPNPASSSSSTTSTRIEQCFGVAPTQVPNIFGARSSTARPRPQPSAAAVPRSAAGYFVFSGPSKTGQRPQKKQNPVAQSRGPLQAPQGRRAAEGWTTKPKQVMNLGKVEKKKFQAQRITPPDATSSSTKSGTESSRKRHVRPSPREENKAERRPKPRDPSVARRGPKGADGTRESASPVVAPSKVATRTEDEPSSDKTSGQEYLVYKRLRNKFRRRRRGGSQQSARRGTAAAPAASAPRTSEDRVDEGGADTSGLPPVADIAMDLSDPPAAPEPVACAPVVSIHTEGAAPATAEIVPAVGQPNKMDCDDDGVLEGGSDAASMDSEEEEKILAGAEPHARRVIDARGEIMKVTIACAVANKKQQRQAEARTLSIFGEESAHMPPLAPIDAMAPPLEILLPSEVETVSGTQSVPDPLNQPESVVPAAPRSGDPLTTASSIPVPVESDRGYSVPSAENIALTQVTSTISQMKVDEQAAAPGTASVHQVDEVVVAAPSAAEPLQPPATAVDRPADQSVYGSRDYRETNANETEKERLAHIQKYRDDYHLKHGYPKGKGRAGGKKSSQGKKNNPKQAAKNTKGRPTTSQALNSRIRVSWRNQDQSQQPSQGVQDEQHPPPSAGPEAAASPIQRDAETPTGHGAAGHQSGGPDPERLSLRTSPAQVDAPPTAANIPTSVSSAGVIPPEVDDNAGNFDAFFAPPKPSA